MYRQRELLAAVAIVTMAGAACQVKKSSNPLSPSVAGPIPGVSITTPRLSSPPAGARIPVDQQPITLLIDNAVTSGVRPISYRFEVAADAAFASVLHVQAGIKPDPSGKTSFRVPGTLPAEKTYYWRALAEDGANTGAFASPSAFTVFTPVVIGAAVVVSPADGEVVASLTPQLTFRNVTRSGPVGAMQYVVRLYADTAGGWVPLGAYTVSEGSAGQTTLAVPADAIAAGGRRYIWAVQATDGANQGPVSQAWSFLSPAAPSTPVPSPAGGGGTPSDFGSLGSVTIVGGSPDVSGFAITSRITSLRFSPGNIHLEHTKTGQWPGVDIGGALQESTLWVFFRINGQWYATGAERWRPGQTDKALSAPSAIGPGWFYNSGWAPMTNYVPRPGEQVGFMVVAGSTRVDNRTPARERSAILMIPFPADGVTASFP